MTDAATVALTDVERSVLHHLATTEDGGLTSWWPAERRDGFDLVPFAWRVEHQRARAELTRLGLAHGPGGEPCGTGRRLTTVTGRAVVDADRARFADWALRELDDPAVAR